MGSFPATVFSPAEKTHEHEEKLEECKCILACPFCSVPLTPKGDLILSLESAAKSNLECKICNESFYGHGSHLDMTITGKGGGVRAAVETSTQFFRLPVIPFIYERGWRQLFSLLWGFPGPHKELELMKEYLKPAIGGKIVDASCGSGLLSRRFAKSGLFSLVIALDFSEAMLQQCHDFINKEKNFPKEKIILVRADISRLPFASNTLDAVHAGAAIHCWPSPSSAVSKYRPGGIFIATTVILDGPPFCCFQSLPSNRR